MKMSAKTEALPVKGKSQSAELKMPEIKLRPEGSQEKPLPKPKTLPWIIKPGGLQKKPLPRTLPEIIKPGGLQKKPLYKALSGTIRPEGSKEKPTDKTFTEPDFKGPDVKRQLKVPINNS